MTQGDRVSAIVARGYTERQARFLVLVMLHSGVCTMRQYCQFAGISRGQKSQDFFSTLVSRGHASSTADANGSVKLFHVYGSSLYDAIGEPDNRNRKPLSVATALERVMLLDAVLACTDMRWLATEREKVSHFTTVLGLGFRRCDLPQLVFGEPPDVTVRYFPDKLPIGLDGADQTTFTFLVTRAAPVDFRTFLQRHAELFRALPRWRVRLLIPGHFVESEGTYLAALREELFRPIRLGAVDELQWFFQQKAIAAEGGRVLEKDRFDTAQRAFEGPRFSALYRRWRELGPRALAALSSPVLADAFKRGTGEVETHVLRHSYSQLQSMVGTG
jgi:hypothetical protein